MPSILKQPKQPKKPPKQAPPRPPKPPEEGTEPLLLGIYHAHPSTALSTKLRCLLLDLINTPTLGRKAHFPITENENLFPRKNKNEGAKILYVRAFREKVMIEEILSSHGISEEIVRGTSSVRFMIISYSDTSIVPVGEVTYNTILASLLLDCHIKGKWKLEREAKPPVTTLELSFPVSYRGQFIHLSYHAIVAALRYEMRIRYTLDGEERKQVEIEKLLEGDPNPLEGYGWIGWLGKVSVDENGRKYCECRRTFPTNPAEHHFQGHIQSLDDILQWSTTGAQTAEDKAEIAERREARKGAKMNTEAEQWEGLVDGVDVDEGSIITRSGRMAGLGGGSGSWGGSSV